MTIRIILLRVLLASWGIPLSWLVLCPLFTLTSGWKIAVEDVANFNRFLWNGDKE